MKLVTPFKKSIKMPPEYVPGKCNIGDLLALRSVSPVFRLFLFIPLYVGLLTALEGTMSFCVLHASRGTYDFHEPSGMAFGRSETKMEVGSDEWGRLDRRKARLMHLEAVLGALVLAGLLALA